MNNKADIEEDIRLLEDYCQVLQGKHLDNRVRAIENILADRERLEREKYIHIKLEQQYKKEYLDIKNKYDSLVEKIKDKFKTRRIELLKNDKETENDIVLDTLQELLNTEKEEH